MLLSRTHSFLFVHIYKNAGRSITTALAPFATSRAEWLFARLLLKLKVPTDFLYFLPCPPHAKALEIQRRIGNAQFDNLFSFAFVRNPWDWQVSLYRYMLQTTNHHQHKLGRDLGTFDRYIRWRCENEVRLQKDFICGDGDELLVDFVGRFERLGADFDTICERIGISASLPMLNVSNRNSTSYRDYYNEETKVLVEKAFEQDIEYFQYKF